MIDRTRVQNAFHRQAEEYDAHAVVQKRVVARLLEIIAAAGGSPKRLLDVGTGTGLLGRTLGERHPDAVLACVDLAPGMAAAARRTLAGRGDAVVAVADAERLPFAAERFDLVASSSTFQWLERLDTAFAEAWRVLVPGGLFAFALFGAGTFRELQESYRVALAAAGRDSEDRTQHFFSADEVRHSLERVGFGVRALSCEEEVEWHSDVPAFLRSVRRIGAGNASPRHSAGLADRRVMVEMMRLYGERFGGPEGIPATYSVIYGVGAKG
ncbi:methyltransferase domain-containing protein [Geobacter pickeringii]|uniref:Malonyl-[acyl-carrier protein] O-methyltransferase n=1 Tax=Geobacter pickeringii TaxID=345632 RepID=A0A0B5BL62_9BACT|nr:methyltransferase domain-containing protein [Geobacter pickeringii]AJE04796.1 malonyl-CoA O-methyltransferase [Geobacter pickeringii]